MISHSKWARLKTELYAITIATLAVFGGLYAVPGGWLLEVGPPDFIQRPGGSPFVVWRTRARIPMVPNALYHARIVKVALPGGPPANDTIVCEGQGALPQRDGTLTELRISVVDWLQDPDCTLRRGFSYYADITVTFQFLGMTKTVTQRTKTISMPIVRTLVGPTFPQEL